MIKVHLLERVMQVVASISKWVASVKNKKVAEWKEAKEDKKINKKSEVEKEVVHIQETKEPVISKAKVMKQWISFIKEDNIIYLLSYPKGNQRQMLCNRDNVVYIDFDTIRYSNLKAYYNFKEYHNKEMYRVKAHSRAPTHYSYI